MELIPGSRETINPSSLISSGICGFKFVCGFVWDFFYGGEAKDGMMEKDSLTSNT